MKLSFHKKLYLCDNIDNVDSIMKNIEEGVPIFDLKLICVSKNVHHILEIVSVSEIFKKKYENEKVVVVGMAYGRKNTLKVVQKIFQDYVTLKKDLNNMKKNFSQNK